MQEGGFYGWPYAYNDQHPQAGFASLAPEKVNATLLPILFEAHSSALDLVFFDGEQFRPEYKRHAFVVLRGSSNRSEPTGYQVVRVPRRTAGGKATTRILHRVLGVRCAHAEVWGRPAALSVAKDGSLLVGDDTAARWRIAYVGESDRAPERPQGNRYKLRTADALIIVRLRSGHRWTGCRLNQVAIDPQPTSARRKAAPHLE